MSGLEIITVNNDLALDVKRTEIKNKIIARVNELQIDIANYRLNNELLLYICNLRWRSATKKKSTGKKIHWMKIHPLDVFSSGFLGTRLPNAICLSLGILGIGILIVLFAQQKL